MKYLYLYIFSIVIIFTSLTELYLKHIGLGDPVRYDSNYTFGFVPKENQKKKRFDGAYVSINDIGLRSIYNWKNSVKKKILFLGDSITYGGSYIDDKETFAHLVCKKITEYICGNAGVNAYSIINIVLRSRYDFRLSEANRYFFVVAPGDFYREYADADTAHFYLNNKDYFLPAISEAISFISTKYDINNFFSKRNDTRVYQNKKELIDFSIELLISEINRLQALNKEVYLIYTVERDDKKSEKKINKYIYEKLLKLELDYFISLEDTLNKNEYFYDSVHYTKLGHKRVSQKIISLF